MIQFIQNHGALCLLIGLVVVLIFGVKIWRDELRMAKIRKLQTDEEIKANLSKWMDEHNNK